MMLVAILGPLVAGPLSDVASLALGSDGWSVLTVAPRSRGGSNAKYPNSPARRT